MNTKNYSKRELDLHFKDIKEGLARIESQTVRTNGRVSTLEKWMFMVVGGLTLLTFLVGNNLLNFL